MPGPWMSDDAVEYAMAGGCVRSETFRRRSWKRRTIASKQSRPSRPDSNETVSGEPRGDSVGAMQASWKE